MPRINTHLIFRCHRDVVASAVHWVSYLRSDTENDPQNSAVGDNVGTELFLHPGAAIGHSTSDQMEAGTGNTAVLYIGMWGKAALNPLLPREEV
jgi:hypothetical protein